MNNEEAVMKHKDYQDLPLMLLGLLVIIIWAAPIIFTAGKTGVYDWDPFMQRFEALRLSILKYHQWPGLNPWIEGGQPLISVPQVTIFSIEGILVLIFGTFWGLRLSIPIYIFIGFIGAWKLSSIFWSKKLFRLLFSFYIIANPAVAYHLSVGHFLFQNFFFMPLFFYYILKVKEDKWSGLKAGIVYGLAFVASPAYIVQYAALISSGLFIWFWLKSNKQYHRAFRNWIMLFFPIFGTLVFYRLVTILFTAEDFSRISGWRAHFDVLSLLKYYFYPYTSLTPLKRINNLSLGTWELCCYVGFVNVGLLGVSLKKGLRWWHVILAMLIWAMIGNDRAWYLMYWIQKIPSFSSHLCFMRIRMFIPLFLGISATWGLTYIWSTWSKRKVGRYIIMLLGVLMVSEVLLVSHKILKSSHVPFVYVGEYNPDRKFRNISRLPGNTAYNATLMNLGWLHGSGDSYIGISNIRVGLDEPGYIGEYYQGREAVEPVYWSPNHIVFENLKPERHLVINMNPGSAWYCNGVQLFPHYRIVEPGKPFEVMADAHGVVDLKYQYPGQSLGLLGTILFLIISIITYIIRLNEKEFA